MTINQYYKNYLWLHKNPKCRLLHFLGQLVTIAFIAYTVSNFYWFLFPLIPFVVYPFAWSGHYIFEQNEPAAFKNPLYAKISDVIMFKDILLGRLSIW
tara:strand:- start:143 stop:436 length:294 start_codon:yes stop_codon:yes gene_type:complete